MEDDDMKLLSNQLCPENGYAELMVSGKDYNEIFNIERTDEEDSHG
jgi:hypothetical protein